MGLWRKKDLASLEVIKNSDGEWCVRFPNERDLIYFGQDRVDRFFELIGAEGQREHPVSKVEVRPLAVGIARTLLTIDETSLVRVK